MVFQRSVIIAVCVSLGAGVLSFLLFRPAVDSGPYGGYGVLSLDQSCSDRAVGEALRSAGIETFFSESSQWAYLDDFGELVKVPLDEYPERLEPFDPRNDGYAERLRSFFVRDGTRRFFIPFNPGKGDSPKRFADRLSAALGDTPYTLEFPVHNQPFSRYIILIAFFGAAALSSLLLSEAPFSLAFLIPLCVPLAFLGSIGLVLTGTLFAFSGSLSPPLGEFFARHRNRSCSRKPSEVSGFSRLMPLVFAAIYGLVFRIGTIPVLTALPVFLSCCCVTGTVLWAESNRDGHIRFQPVSIKKPALGIPAFFRYFKRYCPRTILPWVPAAALALVVPFILPGYIAPGRELMTQNIPVLNAGDYEAHLAFQRSFSLRSLEDTAEYKTYPGYLPYSDYYRYSIGDDGLVMENGEEPVQTDAGRGEFPPFPLAALMDFLEGYTPDANTARAPGDLISILLILVPALPSLIRGRRGERKRGNSLVLNDKRIAA
jgi:hypothetical protein